jgi:hypothetical protein
VSIGEVGSWFCSWVVSSVRKSLKFESSELWSVMAPKPDAPEPATAPFVAVVVGVVVAGAGVFVFTVVI